MLVAVNPPTTAERLRSGDVALLLAVVGANERGERQTVDTVARLVGRKRTQTFRRLCRLRAAGLVAFGQGQAGGLRPLVGRVRLASPS